MINLLGSHLIELYDIGIIIFGLIIGFSFILKLHCFKLLEVIYQCQYSFHHFYHFIRMSGI